MSRTAKTSGSRSTLILVRHARTAMAGTFCGTSDPPLSGEGVAQLPGLNDKLESYPITHIFSSGLQRARQTAESIAQPRGLQVQYLEFLHELAFGSWEGLDWDQVMARDPEYAQRWLDLHPSIPAPGGEDFADFSRRIQHAMAAIAAELENGCAAVVTHAGVIRTFLGDVAGANGAVADLTACDYTSCWTTWREDGRWHLPGQIGPPDALADTERAVDTGAMS
ncbi:MAG: histidine phosphatase family protein [Candidatus Korobacteraceae bacterium]